MYQSIEPKINQKEDFAQATEEDLKNYEGHIAFHDVCISERVIPGKIFRILPNVTPTSDSGKTKYDWKFWFNGEIVSIYDYKGERWHIGGKDREICLEVMEWICSRIRSARCMMSWR